MEQRDPSQVDWQLEPYQVQTESPDVFVSACYSEPGATVFQVFQLGIEDRSPVGGRKPTDWQLHLAGQAVGELVQCNCSIEEEEEVERVDTCPYQLDSDIQRRAA